MKRTYFTLSLLVLVFLATIAQIPEAFNYQATLRDNAGQLLASKAVSLRISILRSSPNGVSVYSETHSTITTNQGIINLQIGLGTGSGTFTEIDWNNGPYYLKVDLDPEGGNNYFTMGTSELTSVPFALSAKSAGRVEWENISNKPEFASVSSTGSYNDLLNKPIIPTNTNELINGAGFLTPGSTAILTNKSGNVSMFTNDMNYAVYPSQTGNALRFLTTDGTNASWAYAVNTSNSPLSIANNKISISKASAGSNGYLSSADWNSFNNKVSSKWSALGTSVFYNDGHIGIGTNNPVTKLNIVGTVDEGDERSFIRLKNYSTGPKASVSIALNSFEEKGVALGYAASTNNIYDLNDFGVITTNGRGFALVSYTGQLRFYTNRDPMDNSYLERMRINEEGNVGIGTTSPNSRLVIADGDVYIKDINKGIIMTSPDGQCWRGTINNSGALQFSSITCP